MWWKIELVDVEDVARSRATILALLEPIGAGDGGISISGSARAAGLLRTLDELDPGGWRGGRDDVGEDGGRVGGVSRAVRALAVGLA